MLGQTVRYATSLCVCSSISGINVQGRGWIKTLWLGRKMHIATTECEALKTYYTETGCLRKKKILSLNCCKKPHL